MKKKAPGIAEGLLLVLAIKDNPRLCRGGKIAYGEGKRRQESLQVRVKKERIHMLISILQKYSVSQIMGYLIRESAPINGHDSGRESVGTTVGGRRPL